MIRLAVFDCDGTLVDSAGVICAAMDLAFERLGLDPPPHAATRRIVGLSLVEAMAALRPGDDPALHARLAASYRDAFTAVRGRPGFAEPLFPGALAALAAIEEAGWLLGIATGKSDRGLARVLEAHGLHARFVTRQTADRHPSKPHPAMLSAAIAEAGAGHAVMIGDTVFDMAMAQAAGADALGVAWGYHGAEELAQAGARAVAARFDDLPALLEDVPA